MHLVHSPGEVAAKIALDATCSSILAAVDTSSRSPDRTLAGGGSKRSLGLGSVESSGLVKHWTRKLKRHLRQLEDVIRDFDFVTRCQRGFELRNQQTRTRNDAQSELQQRQDLLFTALERGACAFEAPGQGGVLEGGALASFC